jgi:hypothetical protein
MPPAARASVAANYGDPADNAVEDSAPGPHEQKTAAWTGLAQDFPNELAATIALRNAIDCAFWGSRQTIGTIDERLEGATQIYIYAGIGEPSSPAADICVSSNSENSLAVTALLK